jgi:hypothetical protein
LRRHQYGLRGIIAISLFWLVFLHQLFYWSAALALKAATVAFSPITRQKALFQSKRALNNFYAIFFNHGYPLSLLLPKAISAAIIWVHRLKAHKNGV